MSTPEITERALRERAVVLGNELMTLARQAEGLFRTSGWVRTSDEPPPVNLRVLGVSCGLVGWFTLGDNGKWTHDYMNGYITEGPGNEPEFWMVLPRVPT